MFKYLFILLDHSSISFCHYKSLKGRELIPLSILKEGISYAMKYNLSIHYIFPDYELPNDYNSIISSYPCKKIKEFPFLDDTDILVVNRISDLSHLSNYNKTIILLIDKETLFEGYKQIPITGEFSYRLDLVIIDVDSFSTQDMWTYKQILSYFVSSFNGHSQFNVLTDRIFVHKMNNCNAGIESITLAPNGGFYVCPAFYSSGVENSVGSIFEGVNIKNERLLRIENAPICNRCDAYNCKRCLWLNIKTTLEINTPSHEQCVASHLERNAAKDFLDYEQSKSNKAFENITIKEINYLDPFDTIKI